MFPKNFQLKFNFDNFQQVAQTVASSNVFSSDASVQLL